MNWLIPTILFALAYLSWRWSFKADEALVAWCRFILAVFLLALSLIFAVVGWLQWLVT